MFEEINENLILVSSKFIKQKEYWKKKLPGDIREAITAFGTHQHKPEDQKGFEATEILFPQNLSAKLIKLSNQNDLALYMVLLAAIKILIYRCTSNESIAVLSPIYKNNETEETINDLLLICDRLHHDMSFKELLQSIRKSVLEAYENQDYPFESLMDSLFDSSHQQDNAFSELLCSLENIHGSEKIEAPGLIFSFLRMGDKIEGNIRFDISVYNKQFLEKVPVYLVNVLNQCFQNMDIKITDISFLSEPEKKKLLEDFNNTRLEYPRDKNINQLFALQVNKTPEAVAVVGTCLEGDWPVAALTYSELNHRAGRLAHLLKQKGVGPDSIVAIKVERSLEMIICMLGILQAGGAYLPIPNAYPEERVNYILQDSQPEILITTGDFPRSNNQLPPTIDLLDKNIYSVKTCGIENTNSPTDLVYIIYTSGSSGKPKGVMLEHRQVINLVEGLREVVYKNYNPHLNVALIAPYEFDASAQQIYAALLQGHTLHIVPDETKVVGSKLLNYYKKYTIDISDGTPTHLRLIVKDIPGKTKGLVVKHFIIAGEVLLKSVAEEMLTSFENYPPRLSNIYGPTETCVDSTWFDVTVERLAAYDTVPIGNPFPNEQVYILDKAFKIQPIGVSGEMCITGDGVSRGYLNQPELTREKYIPHCFDGQSAMYRTGDLARWLPDGNIEYLGRIDGQVKLRGYRIETGEIENQLRKRDEIKEAVVLARAEKIDDIYLCAYIVSETHIKTPDLRKWLSEYLPDYMIPTHFVRLDRLPLTPNGKLDIRAFPAPELKSAQAYIAPRDEMEQKLAEIWSEVLSGDLLNTATDQRLVIGLDDNFFEMGGHSLKATTLVYRIYKDLNIDVKIIDIFTNPTIRELAQKLKESNKREYMEIRPVEEKEYYDLSYAQRRLWILCQFEEDSTAYNIPSATMISGSLGIDAFKHAVQTMTERHESLRTVFITLNGEPKQKIIKNLRFKLEQMDIRSLNGDKEATTRKVYVEFANRALDLEKGPLFQYKLLQLEDDQYLLMSNFHHIINDGWSLGIISGELITLYNEFLNGGQNALSPLKLQYKDYSRWHNQLIEGGHFFKSRQYWLKKFKDKPNGIDLPLDHPRAPIQTFNGARIHFSLEKKKLLPLYRFNANEESTLFMAMLTLWSILLYKYSGQNDVITGFPIAGRKHSEFSNIIGFLVNTLVFRNKIDPSESFADLIEKLREETLTCYDYQDFPFDLLVEELAAERDLSQFPLFNVMIAHSNANTGEIDWEAQGLNFSKYTHKDDFNMSKFDLTFFIDEHRDTLHMMFEYNSDLFELEGIERMRGNFLYLVDQAINNIDSPISSYNIIAPVEYRNVTHDFNETNSGFPPLSLAELFENRVKKCPEKTAVVHDGDDISYENLNKKANQLAHYLREEYHVKANDIIGVSMDRSIDMIIVLWGIIKSGTAYLALDPTYPTDRVLNILDNSKANRVVINKKQPEFLAHFDGEVLDVSTLWEKISRYSPDNPALVNKPSDILYINYTSGSTGTPNGAMLSHDMLTNLIQWQLEKSSIDCSLRCLQFTTINFCVSFQEIMGTLTAGGELHLIGDIERQDINYLMDFLEGHKIQVLFLPFSYLNFLFNESSRWNRSFNHHLKHIITAGEQLKITSGLKRFLDLNPDLKLHNHYGSTEMHVVTSYTLDASSAAKTPIPPAGKPVSNVRIYILDENHNPVPIGVWGELFVAGSSEILGYINNSELTEKKLLHHPELSPLNNHKRLYRSGDIGRWTKDGNIELRGRKDSQVKVRGFRVELGEIESKLAAIEHVKECVVMVKDDQYGNKGLFAYMVVENLDALEIKEIISHYLPQYMIPKFIIMDKLPLMPNGKVDRTKLPEPKVVDSLLISEAYAPPEDEIHSKLVEIWARVLGMDEKQISIDNNFFEIGGHSLKATLVVSNIHKVFNKKIPLVQMFKNPTIREFSMYMKRVGEYEYVSVKPVEKREWYVLSSAQKRLYLLHHMKEDNLTYNMPLVVMLEGKLDIDRLEETFMELIRRHESLRTSFEMMEHQPVQRPHEFHETAFLMKRRSAAAGKEVLARLIKDFIKPFDLAQAPLFRVELIDQQENSQDKFILMIDMHHIISDGSSMILFINEFMAIYEGKQLPALRLQYKDYSQWQSSQLQRDAIKQQEAFWVEQFSAETPVLDLPTDFPRPLVQEFEGSALRFELGKEETRSLKEITREQNVTLYMVMMAIYNIFLAKLSNQEEIVVGTPVACRKHADLQQIIGMFINTLAMKNRPTGGKTFDRFVGQLAENTLKAFNNQDYQYEELVEQVVVTRDASRNPLFDVMLTLQNVDIPVINIDGLKLTPHTLEHHISKFDMNMVGVEAQDNLFFTIEYSSALFKKETIQRFIRYLKKIVNTVIQDPGIKIADIEMFSESEKKQILDEFNGTGTDYPKEKTIHGLFEEQVEKRPHKPAVVFEEKTLTYGMLDERATQMAIQLTEQGVKADSIVAIMVERSVEMLVGVMGILKAGGGYLPIDVEYPEERKQYMLQDSRPVVLLTRHEYYRHMNSQVKMIDIAEDDMFKGNRDHFQLDQTNNPADLAYIIYTSGSTGKPKGVMATHGNVVRLVKNTNFIKFKENDRQAQIGPLEFDASTFEIWGSLLNGLTLCIVSKDNVLIAEKLQQEIRKHKITTMWMTSPLFNQLSGVNLNLFAGLKNLIVGGDVLSPSHINPVNLNYRELNIINGYGPTENTTFSTTFLITKEYERSIPIGKPIANSTAYIVDKSHKLLPVGAVGQLCVGGDGLARGYLNNADLTREKFINSPIVHGETLYQTGDLARWLPDGNIEFIGRLDHQVKIRGFRVELGELESRFLDIEGVKDVLVTVFEKSSQAGQWQEKSFCAYFVAEKEFAVPELRDILSRSLPDYMIPAYFMQLEKMPLTPNGKVDRRALPHPSIETGTQYTAPENEIQRKLVEIWSAILEIDETLIGIDADFFQLGGHSLSAASVISKLHKTLNTKISLVEIFASPTIRELSRFIENSTREDYLSIQATETKEYYGLSSAQKRLYTLQRMYPDSIAYNMPQSIPLNGDIEEEKLEDTFMKLIDRHESLRTSFEMVAGMPVQRIHDRTSFALKKFDLTALSCPEEISQQQEKIRSNFVKPFIPEDAPLMRVGIIKIESRQHILMVDMHHIICDGLSLGIFIKEFMALFSGEKLTPLRIQYKDFFQWQEKISEKDPQRIKKQEEYWLKKFDGHIPQLDMATDYQRPEVQSFIGSHVSIEIEPGDADMLRKIMHQEGVTMFVLLLTIYYVFLTKLTGKEDIVVGTVTAGREHADLQHVIGMFVNMLALRNNSMGSETFADFLKEVHRTTLEALEFQDYPFEDLVAKVLSNRDFSRNALFDVGFTFQNVDAPELKIAEVVTPDQLEHNVSRFDLFLVASQRGEQLFLTFNYCTELFKQTTIDNFVTYFKEILSAVITNRHIPLKEIKIAHQLLEPKLNLPAESQLDFAF